MRFRLRTLLILLAVGPPILAMTWFTCKLLDSAYRTFDDMNSRVAAEVLRALGDQIKKDFEAESAKRKTESAPANMEQRN